MIFSEHGKGAIAHGALQGLFYLHLGRKSIDKAQDIVCVFWHKSQLTQNLVDAAGFHMGKIPLRDAGKVL